MGESPLQDFYQSRNVNPEVFRYYARLARVRTWIAGHYMDDVSVCAAARVAGLTAKYFSRFFLEKTGVRFSSWVHAVRIDNATRMMRASNHSITTVAFDVGFKDLRTFERVFKRLTGMTPREYRNRARPDTTPRERDRGLSPGTP